MPTNPQIVQCNNCDALKKAYDKVECTILELVKNKLANISYNVSLYYNQALLNRLIRYRRVINSRLYNPKYPCGQIQTQDLIKLAVTHAYMGPKCSSCPECFPPIPTTTTTSTTSTTSSTTTSSTTTSSTTTSSTTTSSTTSTTSSSTTTTTTTLPPGTSTTTTTTTTLPPGIALVAKYNDNLGTVCAASDNTVYTSTGVLTIGLVVYIDSGLSVPLIGQTFIADYYNTGIVYDIDPLDGTILSNTGNSC